MKLLDFLTSLPAEEKDVFIDLFEASHSLEFAVRRTMLVLADSEPNLARMLEEPVRDWLKISGPILTKGTETGLTYDKVNPGLVYFAPK